MDKIRVKTKKQRDYIENSFAATISCVSEDGCCITLNSNTVSLDEIAAIIDFIRPRETKNLDTSIVSSEMREVVETWLSYKKEKGQSYKPTGFRTFYKKLCEMSSNDPRIAMLIIEQSMQNNYAGIFPLRNNNNNNNNNNGYGKETITDKIRRTVENATEFKKRIDEHIGKQAELGFGDTDEVW